MDASTIIILGMALVVVLGILGYVIAVVAKNIYEMIFGGTINEISLRRTFEDKKETL